MYFAARKVALPSVGYMLRKETQMEAEEEGSSKAMYTGFSKQLNDLINLYFQAQKGEDIELKIAGSQDERATMMPLFYIEDEATRKRVSDDVKQVLETFTAGNPDAPRMKPLDVVKVLMGIRSERDCVKQFMQDGKFFATYQDFDYEQMFTLVDDVVKQWTLDNIHVLEASRKKRKVESKK